MSRNHILIMAGGVGSRLYPLSTPERPKQFLDVLGTGRTLIQLTYDRFRVMDPDAVFWILTSESYVHFIHEQLPSIPDERILAEPVARNTAPCLCYACRKIAARYPDARLVVTPADAYVPDSEAFASTIRKALSFASDTEALVCVGIRPTCPHTGYGYISQGPAVADGVFKVNAFKEKPCEEVACGYLEQGGYFWNAGIFIWKASSILKEIALYAPGVDAVISRIEPYFYTDREQEVLGEQFPQCEKISIDYAVMEKSANVFMAPGDWEWSDLGSFESIAQVRGCSVEDLKKIK